MREKKSRVVAGEYQPLTVDQLPSYAVSERLGLLPYHQQVWTQLQQWFRFVVPSVLTG